MLLNEFFGQAVDLNTKIKKDDNNIQSRVFEYIIDHDKLHKEYFIPLAKQIKLQKESGTSDRNKIVNEFMPMVKRGCLEYYEKNNLKGKPAVLFPKEFREELCEKLYDHYHDDVIADCYVVGLQESIDNQEEKKKRTIQDITNFAINYYGEPRREPNSKKRMFGTVRVSDHFGRRLFDPRNNPPISYSSVIHILRVGLDQFKEEILKDAGMYKDEGVNGIFVKSDPAGEINIVFTIKTDRSGQRETTFTTLIRKNNFQVSSTKDGIPIFYRLR